MDGVSISLFTGLLGARGADLAQLCEHVYLTQQPDPTPTTSTDGGDEACLAAEAGQKTLAQLLIDLVVVVGGGQAGYDFLNEAVASTGTRRFDDIRTKSPIPKPRYVDDIVDQTEEVDAEPEPEVAAAGAGIPLPPRCIDDATWLSLLDTAWQDHHLATDKQYTEDADGNKIPHGFTKQYVDALADADMLAALDPEGRWRQVLNQAWNRLAIPHAGTHPDGYKQWVLDNMELALARSAEDADLFVKLFREYVAKPLLNDPTAVRNDWWACQ